MSINSWMDKEDMVHIYNGIFPPSKLEIMPFAATWMDLEIIKLSEICQKKTNSIWYHLYLESKIWHKCTYLWNRNRFTDVDREQTCGCQGGAGGERMGWELGISRCKLLYVGWINNKVLLCSTGNYIQYPVINYNGEEYEKECICDTWVTAEITQHQKSTIIQ